MVFVMRWPVLSIINFFCDCGWEESRHTASGQFPVPQNIRDTKRARNQNGYS